MQKIWKAITVLVFVMTTGLIAAPDSNNIEIVDIRKIDSATLQGMMAGTLPHIALQIKKGEKLPILPFVKGDLAEIKGDCPLVVTALQDIYLRNVDGNIFFSTTPSGWQSLKDFIKGNASVGLELNKSKEPVLKIGAEIYKRS